MSLECSRSLSSCFSLFLFSSPKEKNLLFVATVSTIYYLNMLCTHEDEGKPDSYPLKAKKQENTPVLSLFSL